MLSRVVLFGSQPIGLWLSILQLRLVSVGLWPDRVLAPPIVHFVPFWTLSGGSMVRPGSSAPPPPPLKGVFFFIVLAWFWVGFGMVLAWFLHGFGRIWEEFGNHFEIILE